MKQLLWILLLTAVCAFALSTPVWEVKSHKITFKIKNAGFTVDGSFSDFQADIAFEPKNPEKSVLRASVGVASINTGNSMRDRDLQEKKYFNVEEYPRVRMVSKKIKTSSKDKFIATFDLTIRDVTKEVEVPFTYTRKENLGTFIGNFTIDRRDFNVGSNSLILSDDVRVSIEVTTTEK